MAKMECKKWIVGLSILVFALLCISSKAYWDYGSLRVRVLLAEDQTSVFDEMTRTDRATETPEEICEALAYVVSYYPTGTKQLSDSPLDAIVERARLSAVRELISRLRVVTGQDLGDDPGPWIERWTGEQ